MDCFDAQIQCEEFYGENEGMTMQDLNDCYCTNDVCTCDDVEDFYDEDYDGEAKTPYGNDYEIPFDDFMDGEFW